MRNSRKQKSILGVLLEISRKSGVPYNKLIEKFDALVNEVQLTEQNALEELLDYYGENNDEQNKENSK